MTKQMKSMNEIRLSRFERKLLILEAIENHHKQFPSGAGCTKAYIAAYHTSRGFPIVPSNYLLKMIKELYRDGLIDGYEEVYQVNKNGQKINAYYWRLNEHKPCRQKGMFTEEDI